jgi:hypothetical protein
MDHRAHSLLSLQDLEPESLAKLILDSIVLNYGESNVVNSYDEALGICFKTADIIRNKNDSHKASRSSSTTTITSMGNDTMLDICAYIDVCSKGRLRCTSNVIHTTMMRCPLDFTDVEMWEFDPHIFVKQLAPMRLHKRLTAKPCYCHSDVSRQLNLLSANQLIFDPNMSTHSSHEPPSESELRSLGFDRPWTITGLHFDDYSTKHCHEEVELLVQHKCQHLLKSVDFSLFEIDFMLDDFLDVNGDDIYNVERLSLTKSVDAEDDGIAEINDIKSLATLRQLKSLQLDRILVPSGYSELSVLASQLVDLDMENCSAVGDFDHIAQLTKLQKLNLRQCDSLVNVSSISRLLMLSEMTLRIGSSDNLDLNLSHLSSLTKLTKIQLDGPHVMGNIQSLSSLIGLTSLSLETGNVCGNISFLVSFTSLKSLSITKQSICGDTEVISRLSKLLRLSMKNCHNIRGDIAALSHCVDVRHLVLSELPQVQGDIGMLLPHITKLYLCELKSLYIHGDALAYLPKHMNTIHIENCKQLKGNINSLISFHRLGSLKLTGSPLFEGNISSLAQLTALSILCIQKCAKFEGNLSSLTQLTRLHSLKLSGCPLLKGSCGTLCSTLPYLRVGSYSFAVSGPNITP